jgi:hypothetical protein
MHQLGRGAFDDDHPRPACGIHADRPRYILELIQRLVTVSLRTVEIVGSLPPLNIPAAE